MVKRFLLILTLTLVLSLTATGVVCAAQGDDDPSETVSLTLVLAPLVAAATAIERVIEMLFDLFESILLNFGKFLGIGGDYLKNARKEVNRWRDAVKALLQKDFNTRGADFEERLGEAEDALNDAQERLVEFLKSSQYTTPKRSVSMILGIVLGPIVTFSVGLGMFELLEIDLAWWIDRLVTGIIIGTGSAPVHSLIGLLQKTRDAVDEARGLWSARKFRDAISDVLAEEGVLEAADFTNVLGTANLTDVLTQKGVLENADLADLDVVTVSEPPRAKSQAELRRLVSRRTR